MSELLFERYLKNDLDEAGARELSSILSTEEGAREFSEFVQEWTLLAEAARRRASDPSRQSSKRLRRIRLAPASKPSRGWIGWAAGLAAVLLLLLDLTAPGRHPRSDEKPSLARVEDPPPAPAAEPRPDPAPLPRPEPEPVPSPEAPRQADPPVEPAPPPPPPLPPATERIPETRPAEPPKVVRPLIAVLGRVQGEIRVGARKAAAGDGLCAGDGVESAPASLALLEFPDGSRIELGPDSGIERLSEKQGRRFVALGRGTLTATVTKQSAGRSLVVTTPQAEVTVLGTQFTLTILPDSVRLEVREGRVQLKRLPDGASIEVAAGHSSVAAKGLKLESKPILHTRDYQDGPAYAGTRDTSISGADPSRVFGSEDVLEVDGDEIEGKKIYALLRWDLSDLPSGVVVKSAVITLHVVNESLGAGYTFYELKRSWTEADATWRAAAAGQPWRAAGARSSADRGSEALGAVAPRTPGEVKILLAPAGEAAIQSWIRQPASNCGFILANDSNADGFRFYSRESAAVDRRPRLTITYTLPSK